MPPGADPNGRPVPRARGDAVRIEQEGQAYRLATVARAQGDAARFLSVYSAFKATQDVTLKRLYLETMEQVLKNSNKVVIDKSAEHGTGVFPYLPLPMLGGGTKASPPPSASSPGAALPGYGTQPQTPAQSQQAAPSVSGQD